MKPSSDVKSAYISLIDAMTRGDAAAFMAAMSGEPGTLLIGTAPDEWVVGPESIARLAHRMLPALHRAGLSFQAGEAQAFHEGDVGWVADRLTVRAASGQTQELRVLVVFRREHDAWKAAVYAHSVGIPDAWVEVFRSITAVEPGHERP